MRLIVVAGLLLLCLSAQAQFREMYQVKSGESPVETIPLKAQFFLPEFKRGTAFLRNGTHTYQTFNYNHLLDEMMFIVPSGDTLAIAEPKELEYIQLDSAVFYYDKGYLREVEKAGIYKLVERERLIQFFDKVEGAYGTTSGSYAVTTYSNIYNAGRNYKLTVKRDVVFARIKVFFVGDQYNRFHKADKKGFADLFPDKKEAILEYIKNEKLNLNDAGDIEKLFRFCTKDPG